MRRHRRVVGAEQVVHGGDLQGRDAEIGDRLAAADRVAGGIDDDAGDHRHPAGGFFRGGRDQAAEFVDIERVALAGGAAGGQAVHALADHPAHLGAGGGFVDLAVLGEGRGGGRDDPVEFGHVAFPLSSWAARTVGAAAGAVTGRAEGHRRVPVGTGAPD